MHISILLYILYVSVYYLLINVNSDNKHVITSSKVHISRATEAASKFSFYLAKYSQFSNNKQHLFM